MGKIIKFPGKFHPPKVHPVPRESKKDSVVFVVLYSITMVILGFITLILALLAPVLMWVLALISGISFLVMIIMWNQPTYVPMLVFLGTFGSYLFLMLLFTGHETK